MVERSYYLSKLEEFLDTPLVKVIVGLRRSGKSVLLRQLSGQLVARGVRASNILYFNFESLQWSHLDNYQSLYQEVCDRLTGTAGRVYLLFDEIQEVESWEKAVNSFRVDLDCDIVITGSNQRLFSGELAGLLTGRYVEIPIFPLSFAEHLEFKAAARSAAETTAGIDESNSEANGKATDNANQPERKASRQAFDEYLWLGSLPGIHELPANEETIRTYTKDVFNTILLNDVIRQNKIRETELLERIVRFLLDNLGQIFSAKSIASFLKSQGRRISVETVYSHIRALEQAYLIHKVRRFDIIGKRHLETLEKYFVADLGIRHALLGFNANEMPGLLENVVYLELLRRGWSVSLGKLRNMEVDFIASKRELCRYIQVCYLLADDAVFRRELEPLKAIPDNHYRAILSLDEQPEANIEGIHRINLVDFLLDPTW
ncbi:MAG: ATP-binding protein [Actinomycetia bacterium]|nr:ATP-binding protein [Actinomycetes bacterium]